jgi:hypothetical protein
MSATPPGGRYKIQKLNDSDEDDQSPDDFGNGKRQDEWGVEGNFDPKYHCYPFCIVWTPLPLISWFLPFIGHVGICT